jgi:hypothetical protein
VYFSNVLNKIFITALRPEAEPFIRQLKLKRDLKIRSHEIYRNNDYALIISGIGKINAAIATTLAIQKYGLENAVMCSVGIAAAPNNYSIGDLIQINKITDFSTKKNFYPEMLINGKLTEAAVYTVDFPIDPKPEDWPQKTLADMEASATFEATIKFLRIEQLLFFKVISDHFNKSQINKDKIAKLVGIHTEKIINLFNAHCKVLEDNTVTILNPEELSTILELVKELKFTSSQQDSIVKAAISNKVLKGKMTSCLLDKFKNKIASDKKSSKEFFNQVLDVLQVS